MKKKQDQSVAFEICNKFRKTKKSLCIIVDNVRNAQLLKNEISFHIGDDSVEFFPENEILPYDHFSVPESITKRRFHILNKFNQRNIVITTVKNLFERYPPISHFKSFKNFEINQILSIKDLVAILETLNYSKKENVENINDYSLRGGIVDFYTPIYKHPLRIEVFDNKIESIRFFDVSTQSSIKRESKFSISTGSIISLNEGSIKLFKDQWRNYFNDYDERNNKIFQSINNGKHIEGEEIYLPFFFKEMSTFFDLFQDREFLRINDLDVSINEFYEQIISRFDEENIDHSRSLLMPDHAFVNINKIKKTVNNLKEIHIEDKYVELKKDFENVLSDIEKKEIDYEKVLLLTSQLSEYESILKKFAPLINEIDTFENIKEGINLMLSPIVRPLNLKDKTLIIHKEYFSKSNSKLMPQTINNQSKVNINFFKPEDLVVHENYGIGKYEGLEIISTNNTKNEYFKITYLNNESLYVPIRNINLLSKHHNKTHEKYCVYDSLSSNKWKSNKQKALLRARDHAAEILNVESKRSKSSSYQLNIPDKIFNEFNQDFPYELTPDQAIAIDAIRKDINLIKPMNRLLCGDVGFGKTEVAVRASYVSCYSQKQVVILTPSTVLSDQHYESFLKRFKNVPVNIKLLNRHTSSKNKNLIIDDFNNNKIDILIGTHSIFNKDINFKNTGLVVIDEEHKFGIRQKNIIKSNQENIHILYLSATPIPRTMNFIYAGLKDFSFLQTPPQNRLSIKSFLKVNSEQLFKEAINREISRGGQTFIIQNDISKIDKLSIYIKKILPDSRIRIAHGKLKKQDITDAMTQFNNGNIDILICTTIVEMGLDIPNANTILIIDSHKLGLSQLHQLRGRIGRSNRQGYCYLFIPTDELKNKSKNRLDSIIRHSKLGSGYFIAQEDLEIRGAGEILGDKQSGHINTVGLSLYLSMLKNSINLIKSKNEEMVIDTEVNFYDEAYISNEYLPSPIERLKIYKNLMDAETIEKITKIKHDLIDRCGKLPFEVLSLIQNAELNNKIKKIGITSINSNKKNTVLNLSKNIPRKNLNRIIEVIKENPTTHSITKQNKFVIKYNEDDSIKRKKFISTMLNELS